MPIQVNKVTKLTNYKWLNLFDVEYVGKDGKPGHWTFASRKANPVPSTGPLTADAVVIIPIHRSADQTRLVAIKEYRIPLGDYEYAFPAGLYNHKEDAIDVAYRELEEETGLKVTQTYFVSGPAVSSAGLSDESVVYVACECEGTPHTDGNEGSEDITVELLTVEDIRRLRQSDNKISAKALPFMLMFEALGEITWPKRIP